VTERLAIGFWGDTNIGKNMAHHSREQALKGWFYGEGSDLRLIWAGTESFRGRGTFSAAGEKRETTSEMERGVDQKKPTLMKNRLAKKCLPPVVR